MKPVESRRQKPQRGEQAQENAGRSLVEAEAHGQLLDCRRRLGQCDEHARVVSGDNRGLMQA